MIDPTPSPFYTRLFRWFCKDNIYNELQGDLLEEYQYHLNTHGRRSARAWYRKEVLKMIRPSVIKSRQARKTHHNTTDMLKNYTIVAMRSLVKNKLFSLVNIFGLSVSMAVALITIAFVSEINSYDSFHEKSDRIYRVNNNRIKQNGDPQGYASSSLLAGERLRNEFPGVEKVVSIANSFSGDIKYDDTSHPIKGYHVSQEFLEVFTFPLLYGNPQTVLDEPYSVVITAGTALRIFNKKDVVGEVLKRGNDQYQITGVFEDIPGNSHLKFQAVASLSSRNANATFRKYAGDWTNMWSNYIYLLLPEETTGKQAESWLSQLSTDENAKKPRFEIQLQLEALLDIFPGDGKYNQIATVLPKENMVTMIILTLIVIFSACFNYTNLSIARSLKRAKEIGIRKVVGAKKRQIFTQFIAESIMVSLFSLVFAYLLFRLIRPEFIQLNFYLERTVTLEPTTSIYLTFIGFTIAVGFLAGLFPALLMTGFKPVSILKGAKGMKVGRGFSIRKILVGFQFTLSMAFAILVTLAYKQYRFALNFDLGYTTENILNVSLQGNDPEIVRASLEQVAGVQGTSVASMVPSTGGLNSNRAKRLNSSDSVTCYMMQIDHHYLDNLGHELLAGKNIDPNLSKDQMIVNENFIKEMGFSSLEEAIGAQVTYYGDTNRVVGVVKDFHYGTVYDEIKPFAFIQHSGGFYHMNLRVATTDMTTTMSQLSDAWSKVDAEHDFEARFFYESIERMYNGLSSSMKTYGMLAIVAISISMLGLLGMAAYSAEARIKELTIRKVLGATVYNLLVLLSKNFMIIIILAALVAIPVSLELFRSKITQDMQYTIDVGFWDLSSGTILVVFIALITIGSQARKAAKANPAETLRNE